MQSKEKHWLMPAILLPFITVWTYLVGIYFQAGYLDYFNVPSSFAETLPTYLIVGWMPMVGFGLGAFIVFFLTAELLSRWLTTNKNTRTAMVGLLTYIAMLLLILIPQYHGLIDDKFVYYEFGLLSLIMISHFVQWAKWSHIFTEDSMAFYLSRNFGILIVLLILLRLSLPFVYNKGYEAARTQTSYQVFGENPEYAVVFIGSKYLFAMPVDTQERTLKDELKIISLDSLDAHLVHRSFGTGTLKITPTVLPSGS